MMHTTLLFHLISLAAVSCTPRLEHFARRPCGSVDYSENVTAAVYDGDLFVNLNEERWDWNLTSTSLSVSPGCTIETCTKAYFDGECAFLPAGQHSNVTGSSMACKCEKECSCKNVHMKRSSCARAYNNRGCKFCDSTYVELIGFGREIPQDFIRSTNSFTLRTGCNLTLFPQESFIGDGVLIDGLTIVEDFSDEFKSYQCQCNDEEYVPRVNTPRPPSYPRLINIPQTADGILQMLQQDEFKTHPGLLAAKNSIFQNLSPTNAYILVLGTTGAGKSSTINLLFDNPTITKVGGAKSTTTDIHEFRIPVQIDEFGIANAELRVIDSPGLRSTDGIDVDAKFLANLEDYLQTHPELKNRVPNIVLIMHKFTDNRFDGIASGFTQMIRGYDSFRSRITDDNFSNVIYVFTHFCSDSLENKRNPERRLAEFQQVIQGYSLFPRPIIMCVAENKPRESHLPMLNGYYKLPNGEYYPRNLFEKIEYITKNRNDAIGLAVIRTVFREPDDLNITTINYKVTDKEGPRVEHYLNVLASTIYGLEETQISKILANSWNTTINADLKRTFPGALTYLQKILHMQNIFTVRDLPGTTTEVLKLLMSIKSNGAIEALLDVLRLRAPPFPRNVLIGSSYNIFQDNPLPTSPFELKQLKQSDIGFALPEHVKCEIKQSTADYFNVYDSTQEYVRERLLQLGVRDHIHGNFSFYLRAGNNIRENSFHNNGCRLNALREVRVFEFSRKVDTDITEEFEAAVKALPPFNQSDHTSVEKLRNFFLRYGTHVVDSVSAGGSIEIQLRSNKACDFAITTSLFDLIKFAEGTLPFSDLYTLTPLISNQTIFESTTEHSISFSGGDQTNRAIDFARLGLDEATKLLKKWKKSISFSPIILENDIRLVPISYVVKSNSKLGNVYGTRISEATAHLFNSTLKYLPPSQPMPVAPVAREFTPQMIEFRNNITAEILKIQLNNERIRSQMDNDRLKMEAEYQKQRIARQNEQELTQLKWQEEVERRRQESEQKTTSDFEMFHQLLNKTHEHFENQIFRLVKLISQRSGSCLRGGTRILLSDGREKQVEDIKVDDVLLDVDLQPTRVIGASYEFLLDQHFFGFEGEGHFFTNTHIFAGPELSDGKEEEKVVELRLFAQSTTNLYTNNPLMEFLNVSEMSEEEGVGFTLFHINSSSNTPSLTPTHLKLERKQVQVSRDSRIYSPETKVYFLEVDSQSGTYFANNYLCRHELPPLHYWRHTMGMLLRVMDSEAFEIISQLPYTINTIVRLEDAQVEVLGLVQEYLDQEMRGKTQGSEEEEHYEIFTLEGLDIHKYISQIFSSPTISTAAMGLYARAGKEIAGYLDCGSSCSNRHVGRIQHKLLQLIRNKLYEHFSG